MNISTFFEFEVVITSLMLHQNHELEEFDIFENSCLKQRNGKGGGAGRPKKSPIPNIHSNLSTSILVFKYL